MKLFLKILLIFFAVIVLHGYSSETYAACEGTFRFGAWNDNGSVCQLSSSVVECNGFKDRQTCENFKSLYSGSSCAVGSCSWVSTAEPPEPDVTVPQSASSICAQNNGTCFPNGEFCRQENLTFSCGSGQFCCVDTRLSCEETNSGNAYCAPEDVNERLGQGACDAIVNAACSQGKVCCLKTASADPAPDPECKVSRSYNQCGGNCSGTTYGANTSMAITASKCGGSTTENAWYCSGTQQCANGCDPNSGKCIGEETTVPPDPGTGGGGDTPSCPVDETYNECGCFDGSKSVPTDRVVSVTRYACGADGPEEDQFVCGQASEPCANGCFNGACVGEGTPAPSPTPQMCEPGKPAGSKKGERIDRDSFAPQCKIIEEWYGPNCEIIPYGKGKIEDLNTAPAVDCSTPDPTPDQSSGKLVCTLDAKIVDGDDIEVTIPKPSGNTEKYNRIRWRVGDTNHNYVRDEHTAANPTVTNFYSHRDLPLGTYRIIAEYYPLDGGRPAEYCGEKWLTVKEGSSTPPSTGTGLSFPSGRIASTQSGGKVTVTVTSSDATSARIYMHKGTPLESSTTSGTYDPAKVENFHYLLSGSGFTVTVDEPKQAGEYSVYANLEKSYPGFKSGTTDKSNLESIKVTGCSWNGKSYIRFYDDAVSFNDVNGFSLPQCNGTTGTKKFTVSASTTQQVSDVNFSSNKKDLDSWLACYNNRLCTKDQTMDSNSDGQVNILDFNYLVNL